MHHLIVRQVKTALGVLGFGGDKLLRIWPKEQKVRIRAAALTFDEIIKRFIFNINKDWMEVSIISFKGILSFNY